MTANAVHSGPSPRTRYTWLAILGFATFAVYSRALFCDFVYYDDGLYVFDNKHVREGITIAGLRGIFTTGETGTWQPISLLSHAIDCELFGLNAWGHHLSSITLHTANALLLAVALARLTGRFYPSLAVAAIFALHPAHVESVAWVSERKDVLSTVFWMLCLIAYERYARRRGAGRYAILLLMLALGLMTKPMLVTVPCVLLLLDYWPLRRFETGAVRLTIEKAPLFALVAASCVVTIVVQRQHQAIVSLDKLPLDMRLGNVAVSYVRYIAMMIWPSGLAIDYPHPKDSLSSFDIAASCALIAAVTAFAVAARNRAPYALVGWLWYLGTLVPVVGFVHIGEQGMADRYTYIPTIGIAIAVVWGVDAVVARATAGRGVRAPVAVSTLALLAFWAVLTWSQIGHWKNTETLWARAVAVNPNHERAQRNLGAVYFERKEYAKAVPHFEVAAALNPDDPRAFHNLGIAQMRLGNTGAALDALARASAIDPQNVDTRNAIGICLIQLNRDAEAVRVLMEANRSGTGDAVLAADIAANLGVALWKSGRVDDAIDVLKQAIGQYPDDAKLRNILGIVFNAKGRRDDAMKEFREALRIDPSFEDARRNLNALGG
ncbi:MAG: tetratricopeptide repeat protein [Candidatus Hydrogenedentes bacterium]|nr:tetratricopeptide repeat protein [Candidatus Hydrogenedentota bacterium]